VHEPTRETGRPGRQAVEQVVRELGAEQDLAHPDEQRQAVSVQVLTEPQMVDGMTSSIGASAKSNMPMSATPMSDAATHTPDASRRSRATARSGLYRSGSMTRPTR
jgi:hypothetical protein